MSLSRVCARVGNTSRHVPGYRFLSTNLQHQDILLTGLPNFTTRGDIRRAIKGKLDGVDDVKLDYYRFRQTGRAYITLTRPEYLRENLRSLERFTICGLPVQALAVDPIQREPTRSRGEKGREEAIARGVVTGTGADLNIPHVERTVVIRGISGRAAAADVERLVAGFKLQRSKSGRAAIVKVPLPEDKFSLFSRFIVTLDSVSEARRLIRTLHLTKGNKQGQVRTAEILY